MTHAAQVADTVLACPACGVAVPEGDELVCASCGREYGAVAGVPDLRLDPDRWQGDLSRARRLDEVRNAHEFEGLLREYWRGSDRATELVDRFVAGDLAGADKAEPLVAAVEVHRGRPLGPGDRVLEVGCGTGAFSLACARRGAAVVASDLSLQCLVLAGKRFEEAGADVRLVCSNAEHPPFEPGSFDVVAAVDVIEHAGDQAGFLRGCARVLAPGGVLFLTTPNRFSLGLEPHVRLWGVGYLPRGLARRYVEIVRKSPYEHVRLLSARRLRRLLADEGLNGEIVVPEIPAATQRLYHGIELRLVRTYNRVRRIGLARRALVAVGPFFHVFAARSA